MRYMFILIGLMAGCNTVDEDDGDATEPVETVGQSDEIVSGMTVVNCETDTPAEVYVPSDAIWQMSFVDGDVRISGTDDMYLVGDTLSIAACAFDSIEVRWIRAL